MKLKKLFLASSIVCLSVASSYVVANAEPVGDSVKGKALYVGCSGCHGADGMGNEALKAPRLAGQKAWYTSTQLKNFKSGLRGTISGDTGGAMMRPMASLLADDQAIADVSAYLESL